MKKTKANKVWAYLIKHPNAKTKDVSKACGCTDKYVYTPRSKIGTPKEVLTKPTTLSFPTRAQQPQSGGNRSGASS